MNSKAKSQSFLRPALNKLKSIGMSIIPSIVAILIGLLFGFIVMLIASPADAFSGFATVLTRGFSKMPTVLFYATPLIMTGLSVGFAYRMGLFNIGASGQYTMGMFFAMYVAFMTNLPRPLSWIVCCLAAMAGGALWGALPGLFKAFLNINEVITSIMFNYIGMYLVDELVSSNAIMYIATKARTNYIPAASQLPAISNSSNLNIGTIIAVLIAILLFIVLMKTTFGYELRTTGLNKHAAKYAGMNSTRNIIITMCIAGALSGLAGALYILSPSTLSGSSMTYEPVNVVASEGFNGIAVALLGCSHPIGIIFSAVFISFIQRGGTAAVAYKPEIIDVMIAIIIYFSAFAMVVREMVNGKRHRRKAGGDMPPDPTPIPDEDVTPILYSGKSEAEDFAAKEDNN